MLRAQFEESFAAQMERRSDECRRKATAALAKSQEYSYPWLQIQPGLEKGVCSVLMSDIGAGKKATIDAMNRAREAGYGALYLRAVGFVADSEFAAGDQARGWKLNIAGLKTFWSAPYPLMRGYNDTGSSPLPFEHNRPNRKQLPHRRLFPKRRARRKCLLCSKVHGLSLSTRKTPTE
jgi:hypothetical protein